MSSEMKAVAEKHTEKETAARIGDWKLLPNNAKHVKKNCKPNST